MKKTFRLGFSLMLVLALAAALGGAALAADASIVYNGGGDFDLAPGSGYTDTDLFDNFKDVMPGDVLTENITFTNRASDCDYVRLYIRAVAHDEQGSPLSYSEGFENADGKDQAGISGERDETVASMSDFLAQLSMKVYNGAELIYEASPDELDGLKDNKLLGTFRRGETAKLRVELTVPAELGNEYAYRVGEVDWVFHVDALNDPKPVAKTGDTAQPLLWLGMAVLAMAAGGVLTAKKKNRG